MRTTQPPVRFSAFVDDLTDDEIRWFINHTESVPNSYGMRCPKFTLQHGDTISSTRYFICSIEEDENKKYFWLRAQECEDIWAVAEFIQSFLRECRPTECWGMTFATSCDRLQIGDATGGALFVTENSISLYRAEDILAHHIHRHKKGKQQTGES